MKQLTLYTKPGCHLCEEMKDLIEEIRLSHPVELTLHNILDDLELYHRYKNDIPVLFLDDREIARHRVTREQLLKQLTTDH